jgi:hypothetical protein
MAATRIALVEATGDSRQWRPVAAYQPALDEWMLAWVAGGTRIELLRVDGAGRPVSTGVVTLPDAGSYPDSLFLFARSEAPTYGLVSYDATMSQVFGVDLGCTPPTM